MDDLSDLEEFDLLEFNMVEELEMNFGRFPVRRRSRSKMTALKQPAFTPNDTKTIHLDPDSYEGKRTSTIGRDEILSSVIAGNVETLNLRNERLSDSDFILILQKLNEKLESKVMKTLILTRNSLTNESVFALADVIARLESWTKTLTRIDLNQNDIGEEGFLKLHQVLVSNRGKLMLQRLDISWNGDISLDTKILIAEELLLNSMRVFTLASSNKTEVDFPELYLHGQSLGDEGISRICSLLTGNNVIRRLFLGDNDIRIDGGHALLSLLETNFTITHIDLEENYDLEPSIKEMVGSCLVRNRNLEDLYLCRYELDLGPPVHKSKTSEVVFGKDLKSSPPEYVAIKKMFHYDQFERELKCRFLNNENILRDCVINIHGWHSPHDVEKVEFSALRRTEISETYILVMPRASRSLWLSLGSERIARYNMHRAMSIFKEIVLKVKKLHNLGYVHCDLKPRNILFVDDELVLCDLDATMLVGDKRTFDMKCSTSYCPPELLRAIYQNEGFDIHPSFDIWSLGIILFEILSGRHIFHQDIGDDNVVSPVDITKICLWLCIDDSILDIIDEVENIYCEFHDDIKHLLRWCLQSNPADRPTIDQLISHRLLGGSNPAPEDVMKPQIHLSLGDVNIPSIVEMNNARMKYHVFISHFQMEASGDVGTMYHLLHRIGVNTWRDMNVSTLTEAAMCQGVYDSDVFILFLTNSALSRNFCIKEITWALYFCKPIIVIVETEDRFYNWDWDRWTADQCQRSPTSINSWEKGWLQNDFQKICTCYPHIYDLIKEQRESCRLLPFRRREFEVDALVQEIMTRACNMGVSWRYPSVKSLICQKHLKVFVIADPEADNLVDDLKSVLLSCYPSLEWTNNLDGSSNGLVLLTHNVLDTCEGLFTELIRCDRLTNVFLYSSEYGWDFGRFYSRNESPTKTLISSSEALNFRLLDYEKKAMAREILRRMIG